MTARTGRVTVLLPTFNRAAFLPEAIESILNQTVKPLQLIVINDGSSDDTEHALAPYFDRIEYIRKENGGKSSALNIALPRIKGEYVWVFDDDDVACDDALERFVAALEAHPEAGFAYAGSFICHSDPKSGKLDLIGPRPTRAFPDEEYFIENLLSCYTPSPAVMVRTEIQRQAGEYSEKVVRADDFEMSIRWGLISPAVRIKDPDRPAYFKRFHSGVRGAHGVQYQSSEIKAVSRRDSRAVLRELAGRIEPRHYLPCDRWNEPLDERLHARALVRRWAVHTQKAMWPEATAELEALAGLPLERLDITDDVRRFGMRAFFDTYMLIELGAAPEIMREIGSLLRHPNLARLRTAAAVQLYYRMLAALKPIDISSLRVVSRVVGSVLGLSSFPVLLLRHRAHPGA